MPLPNTSTIRPSHAKRTKLSLPRSARQNTDPTVLPHRRVSPRGTQTPHPAQTVPTPNRKVTRAKKARTRPSRNAEAATFASPSPTACPRPRRHPHEIPIVENRSSTFFLSELRWFAFGSCVLALADARARANMALASTRLPWAWWTRPRPLIAACVDV